MTGLRKQLLFQHTNLVVELAALSLENSLRVPRLSWGSHMLFEHIMVRIYTILNLQRENSCNFRLRCVEFTTASYCANDCSALYGPSHV